MFIYTLCSIDICYVVGVYQKKIIPKEKIELVYIGINYI